MHSYFFRCIIDLNLLKNFLFCGMVYHILLLLGAVNINGAAIRLRPSLGITVMLWLKLDTIQGDQEIFMTTNPENVGNKHGQYHFQINAGTVRWFHRNAQAQVWIF